MKLNKFRRFAAVVSRSRFLILAMACVMLVGGAAGGTVAWLMRKSNPVVNTFTYGNIGLAIVETDTGLDQDNNADTNTYMMMPAAVIEKDPRVIFHAGSENAWLFVKMEKSDNFDDFITCAAADGWAALEEYENIFFRTADQREEDQIFPILKDNQVQVKASVTAAMLNALSDADLPTVSFTAYAVQRVGVADAAAAWQIVEQAPANP